MWEIIFEVLKYTIPALVVFLACYFILRQYLNSQYDLKSLEVRSKYSKNAIPLKLQAYERLLLFCERISIPNLVMRLNSKNMSVDALKHAMMISVQKEYEHNIAQQLYTSQKLWDIIKLVKNDMVSIISKAGEDLPGNVSSDLMVEALFKYLNENDKNPVDLAIQAVKEESKIILDV
ncbi:MAG: hypothetical protein HKN67_12475 [Saprospiraceae bacterium]|nr:hypothetical protein [Bacteroidia bacterium]MBT8229247.1 hypothetical protein [Bacteroidia bacterium]NNF22751.1 hypothetical protein [Saprospiraceae bacterium]NNK89674.1 hypothetical protein [Saprospiraceae bacterium]